MPFKVGEKVVYPNHGVGVIEQITHNHLNGRAEEFYLIRILSNSLRVTIPCTNADCVGLRHIIKAADVPRVLSRLRNGKTESPRDWKFRFKQNSEKMRTGLLEDVAEVLKSLVALSNQKVLSFREKKMLERARQLLVAELATVRNVTEGTIEQNLQKILGKSGLHLPEAS
jgi:CarD family transcriptional regulator